MNYPNYQTFQSGPVRSHFTRLQRYLVAFIIVIASWVFSAGVAAALAGCADPVKDPSAYVHQQEVKAEGTYDSELMACTAKAKSLAESKLCEETVDIKWGVGPRPAQDGGK